MDIPFGCPECRQHMVIDEAGAGLLVSCPKCGREIRVPSLEETKPSPATKPANVSQPDKERTVALKWTPPSSSVPQKPKQ
jgi:DNA-directed RNA polymerase subunit M/transcription elongation factor TFIIS